MNIADLPPDARSMSAPGTGPAPADPYRQARDALHPIIVATAPWRPRCASRKDRSRILSQVDALGMPWVQLNPPLTQHWLQFDIDRTASSHAWADANLPPPTYVVVNPDNGHSQYGYALAAPVGTGPNARERPQQYLKAIDSAFRVKLGADPNFTGHMAKNPLHPWWRLWLPAGAHRSYELGELAEYVDLDNAAPIRDENYAEQGRNCKLFEQLRQEAYRMIRRFWRDPDKQERLTAHLLARGKQLAHADFINDGIPMLDAREIRGIARSVARWACRHMTPEGFRKKQAEHGRRNGLGRRAQLLPIVLELRERGLTQQQIAAQVGVSQPTVGRWLARSEMGA